MIKQKRTKITKETKEEIIKMYYEGVNSRNISSKFDINSTTIYQILKKHKDDIQDEANKKILKRRIEITNSFNRTNIQQGFHPWISRITGIK